MIQDYLRKSISAIAATAESAAMAQVDAAAAAITAAFRAGKPLLVCGNGGSASDAVALRPAERLTTFAEK